VTERSLISLTKSLSSELAPKGIRVNCVAPGWVDTENVGGGARRTASWGPKIMQGIPVGRAAHAREIAGPNIVLVYAAGGVHLRVRF